MINSSIPPDKEPNSSPILEIADKTWSYVKDRIMDRGQVYRLADGSQFLRIGPTEGIAAEANFGRSLYEQGFPVPEILNQGISGDRSYYIERSLGAKNFGEQFQEEYSTKGSINDTSFTAYCESMRTFFAAQLRTSTRAPHKNELRQGIFIDNVLAENTDIDANELEDILKKVQVNLRTLPIVLTHGDLSPYNMFANGVIDFEHKFLAPAGYDALVGIIYERFWDYEDDEGNSQLPFDFSDAQISSYFDTIDAEARQYGIEDLSSFTDDFVMLRAIWSLAYEKQFAQQAGSDTKWNFRRSILRYCCERYIAGEPIKTAEFKEFGKKEGRP